MIVEPSDADDDVELPWGEGKFFADEKAYRAHVRAEQDRLDELALRRMGIEPPKWRTPPDRARTLGGQGQRLELAIPALNTCTRGGPRTGKLVVVGGAPGAGKTTLCVQLVLALARAGVLVGILAADEEADGLLIRIGQQLGLQREQLEDGVPDARAALARYLEQIPDLVLVDAEEDTASVEDVSVGLTRRRRADQPSVLLVDSIQTVRAAGTDAALTDKKRIDLVMAALKRAAKVDGHLVVATSELNRGAYRSSTASENTVGLAAFKESGGVEFGASLALVLRSVKDDDAVDGEVVKNRLGGALPEFRLTLDRRRALFVEVEKPDVDEMTERRVRGMATARQKVLNVIRKQIDPLRTKEAIWNRSGISRTSCWKVLKELLAEGSVAVVEGVYREVKNA